MADMYVFETTTLLDQLDQILMKTENERGFGEEEINEIFRTMHTIKGSSAMMGLENMSKLAHAIEDMFYIIRENNPVISSPEELYDLIFAASDLMKAEIELISEDEYTPTDFSEAMSNIEAFVSVLKGGAAPAAAQNAPAGQQAAASSKSAEHAVVDGAGDTIVKVFFEEDCKMENLRASLVVNRITEMCSKLEYIPEDIEGNSETAKTIVESGFEIHFRPKKNNTIDEILNTIKDTPNVCKSELICRGAEGDDGADENIATVRVHFDDDCKMENLRAALVINNIKDVCEYVTYEPADIEENSETSKVIVEQGFVIHFEA